MPEGHSKQLFDAVAALYFPASQTTQELDPEVEAYDPAVHAAQPDPLDEKDPAGHGEQESEEKHEFPSEHVVVQIPEQTLDAPIAALYFPASQTVHLVALLKFE